LKEKKRKRDCINVINVLLILTFQNGWLCLRSPRGGEKEKKRKRDFALWQKRPNRRQKRPSVEAKETYYDAKET